MAVINLRDVDEELVARLKSEAALAGVGFHEYVKGVLSGEPGRDGKAGGARADEAGDTAGRVEPRGTGGGKRGKRSLLGYRNRVKAAGGGDGSGHSDVAEAVSGEPEPEREDGKAAAVQAVARIGETVLPASEVERPDDRCPGCGAKMSDFGSTWRCASCRRNYPK